MKIQKPRPLINRASLLAAAAMLAVAPPAARAANLFWDVNGSTAGLGGTGTWDTTSANWFNAGSNTTASGTGATAAIGAFTTNDVAYFAGTAGTSYTVTLGEAVTIGGLNFSGFTNYDIVGASALTLGVPAGKPAQPTVSVAGGSRVTVTAKLSGSQGLLKTGNGTLVLGNSANDFTGDLLIRGGAVVITDSAQLGAGTGPVMVQGVSNTGNPGFSGGSLVVQGGATGISVAREVSASGRGPNAANASGAILSVGNNNFTGGVTMGTQTETRFLATPGYTTVSGDFSLGSGASTVLYGDGNFVISGKLVGYDAGTDRLVKTGLIYGTTLWLQGDNRSSFNGQVRLDSGTVRVTSAANLGSNASARVLDWNGGGGAILELRADTLPGFTTKGMVFRDAATGTLFADHGLGGASGPSAVVGQTLTLGTFSKSTGLSVTTTNFIGRNGYSVVVSGVNGVMGSESGAAAGLAGWTIVNNLSGLLTLNGSIFNTNTSSANRTLVISGNADTLLTGSIVPSVNTASHVFTKQGTGQLIIQGSASTYTGATNASGGTLSIGSVGALGTTSGVQLGNATTISGTLTYTGPAVTFSLPIGLNVTTANAYLNSSGTGPMNVTGAITALTGAKTFVLGGTNAGDNIVAVPIPANATNLQKIGSGTWVLNPATSNLYTGLTTVSNGTLKLQEVAGNLDLVPDAGALVFNSESFANSAGGLFSYFGAASVTSTETVGPLTATAGHGVVQVTAGTGGAAALTFGSLAVRGAGATLDLAVGSGGSVVFSTAPSATNGIVGGWATYNGVNWIVPGAAGAAATALSSYTSMAASGLTTTANYLSTADLTVAGGETVNSLKLAGAHTLTLGGVLTVSSSGVLFDNSTGAATVTGGALGASGAEVIIHTGGSTPANALTVASLISGAAGSFTKSGNGTLVVTGANTFTGNVNVNAGTLRLSGNQAALGASQTATTVLNLRQGTTLDLNGAGSSVSNWTGAANANRIAIGALVGSGSVVNANASPVILNLGNGGANGTFNGTISQTAGAITLVKNGGGTQSIVGAHNFTGPTVLRGGTLAVTSLANIGQPSGIGAGDATSDATNAASLILDGGRLLYTGAGTTSYDNRVQNIFQVTQTPSVSIDRLFTLTASGGAIESNGTYGNNVLGGRNENNAALVFSNTGAVQYAGTIAPGSTVTLTLAGNSTADNRINLLLVDPAGAKLSVSRSGYSANWILGNAGNTYSGDTLISGGALVTGRDGAGLSPNSNLAFQDWGGVYESSGTFSRALGTGPGQWRAKATHGKAGFSAANERLVVDWSGLSNPVWGNSTGTANFLRGGILDLNSVTSLADVEIRGAFQIAAGAGSAITGNVTTTGDLQGINLSSGNTAGLSVGQAISGNGIPAGSFIREIVTDTLFYISQNPTIAGTGVALTVSGDGWREFRVNDNGTTGLDFATVSSAISGTGAMAKSGGGTPHSHRFQHLRRQDHPARRQPRRLIHRRGRGHFLEPRHQRLRRSAGNRQSRSRLVSLPHLRRPRRDRHPPDRADRHDRFPAHRFQRLGRARPHQRRQQHRRHRHSQHRLSGQDPRAPRHEHRHEHGHRPADQ